MIIVDVELTLFRWDGIPPVVYGPNIRMPGGSSTLGLLAIHTDEGVTGHSFLGGATRGAELEGRALIGPNTKDAWLATYRFRRSNPENVNKNIILQL